jgi:hypothetical protein
LNNNIHLDQKQKQVFYHGHIFFKSVSLSVLFSLIFISKFNLVSQQWVVFILLSIAIAVYLYINGRRREKKNDASSAIRRDNIQGGSKGKSPNKRN